MKKLKLFLSSILTYILRYKEVRQCKRDGIELKYSFKNYSKFNLPLLKFTEDYTVDDDNDCMVCQCIKFNSGDILGIKLHYPTIIRLIKSGILKEI